MSEQPHVVMSDPRLPTDSFILEGVDVSHGPLFTVSEVAKMFFARSPHWVRWRERKGFFVLEPASLPTDHEHDFDEDTRKCKCGAENVEGHRSDGGARRYDLTDVEKMAHALASKGAINGSQLTNALLLVQTEAKLYGHL